MPPRLSEGEAFVRFRKKLQLDVQTELVLHAEMGETYQVLKMCAN